MKKFEKVEKTRIISTKFSLRCTPSVILGYQVLRVFKQNSDQARYIFQPNTELQNNLFFRTKFRICWTLIRSSAQCGEIIFEVALINSHFFTPAFSQDISIAIVD